MLYVSVPIGDSWGAGVMGTNLVPALAKLTTIKLLAQLPAGHPLSRYVDKDYNPERPYAVNDPMFHLAQGGASFLPFNREVWSYEYNVGYAFIEFPKQAVSFTPHARRYFQSLIAGSSWGEEKLREMGILDVSHAIQGIDLDVFHPDPNGENPLFTKINGAMKDDGKFYIFSGGKAEYRKGTDVVIAAYKILARKYKDIHLVAAWGNHWLDTMNSLVFSKHLRWVSSVGTTWKERIQANMTFHGIDNDRYTLIDFMPNFEMSKIYHRCHLGVFPNRCEAGTNMVLTEFMACGIPVVATRATGHKDIILQDTALCQISGTIDENEFFDPNLDDVISSIEWAYANRERAQEIGLRGAKFVSQFTWERCAQDVLDVCT